MKKSFNILSVPYLKIYSFELIDNCITQRTKEYYFLSSIQSERNCLSNISHFHLLRDKYLLYILLKRDLRYFLRKLCLKGKTSQVVLPFLIHIQTHNKVQSLYKAVKSLVTPISIDSLKVVASRILTTSSYTTNLYIQDKTSRSIDLMCQLSALIPRCSENRNMLESDSPIN